METTLLRDLIEFIEHQIDERGLFKVILAPVTIVGALVAIGAISGDGVFSAAVRIVVAVMVFVLVIGLAVRNRELRTDLEDKTRMAGRYAQEIVDLHGLDYDILRWEERMEFGRQHMTSTCRIHIRVNEGSPPLKLCWLTSLGPDRTVHEAEQRGVRVKVLAVDEGNDDGARLPVVNEWQSDGLRTFVDFTEALEPGRERQILVQLQWPGYDSPLCNGNTEVQQYIWHRKVHALSLTYTFAKDVGLRTAPAVATTGGVPKPKSTFDGPSGVASVTVAEWTTCSQKFSIRIDPR